MSVLTPMHLVVLYLAAMVAAVVLAVAGIIAGEVAVGLLLLGLPSPIVAAAARATNTRGGGGR
jgi:uncharacterized membrane protein YfcA